MDQESPRKLGLVLGSGAARGWAHAGAIRALSERGIHADCVAGTSIGAIVGAAYAGDKMDVLESEIRRLDWRRVLYFFSDPSFHRSGLIDGRKITDFMRVHSEGMNLQSLPTPLRVVATDLGTGREVVLSEGDIIDALRASIAIPGIFIPVTVDDAILVDGGLVNPVPVSVARRMGADYVIAVDIGRSKTGQRPHPTHVTAGQDEQRKGTASPTEGRMRHALSDVLESLRGRRSLRWRRSPKKPRAPHVLEVLLSSINIMEMELAEIRLEADPADLLIRPSLDHIGFFEFNRAEEAMAEGYRATVEALDALPDRGRSLARD